MSQESATVVPKAPRQSNSEASKPGIPRLLLLVIYIALVVYGSLYPFRGWTVPQEPVLAFLSLPFPDHLSRADLLTNLLAYIPLGVLAVWALRPKIPLVLCVSLAVILGSALSFTMEAVQAFLPARTSSNVDLEMNIAGTLIGSILVSSLRYNGAFMIRASGWRSTWFNRGRAANVGLTAIGLWALSQLSPFLPSMDVSSIQSGFAPLWHTLLDPQTFSFFHGGTYALNILGLGFLSSAIAAHGRSTHWRFVLFAGFVLITKPFLIGRDLSLEAVCGFLVAGLTLLVFPKARGLRALMAAICLLGGLVLQEITPGVGPLHGFNWIPLAGELDNTVSGFQSILEGLWPSLALVCITILAFGPKYRPLLTSGFLMVLLVFALEWSQQQTPDRIGDITPVLLAAAAWLVASFYAVHGWSRSAEPVLAQAKC